MPYQVSSSRFASVQSVLVYSLLFLAFAATPKGSWAQTATISGNLSAFDVLNDTGQPAHGFEIQIEGAAAGDLYYTVPAGRYGNPSVVPYATGVYVRYQSAYNSATGQYAATTPPATTTAFSWQDCYLGGAGYSTSGCEHVGQSMRALPPGTIITVTGRWLVDDPNNPGQLIPVDPPAAVPFVGWFVATPTTTASAAPIVVAKAVAPIPAPPAQFGDAQWVKIYKTELPRSVSGDELTSDNTAVVPEDPTQIETAWDILQTAPPNVNTRKNRNTRNNQAPLSITAGSVVRRYELYKYTGAYDPLTHEVACADGTCTAPSTGELGTPLSAHNTASNVVPDTLAVTKSGSGASSASITGISCGNTCVIFGTNGAVVSLNASHGSTVFTGWTGACSGTQLNCSVTVNGKTVVGANFMLQFTLSVGHSNPGTVVATPNGNDRALNCGGNCSAKFTDGTAVTLTAIPPDGKQFVNWSGACSGTSPTCNLTISKNTSVLAVFSK